MNIYFSGIGGIGLSSLAQFCLNRGDKITGSDLSKSLMTEVLIKKGVKINFKQIADNIKKETDLFIYSEAVPPDNPEMVMAEKLKIPTLSYFEYLGEISRNFKIVAIAGTHGKTTTTGLIASGLISSNNKPTVVVGTVLEIFNNTNFLSGDSDLFIVEACEYRNNFRFLDPEIVILTSIDYDHIDAFPTKESYYKVFNEFVSKAKIVIYIDGDIDIEEMLKNFSGKKISVKKNKNIDLKLIGDFNKRNASLALALADELEVEKEYFKKGIESFNGISRRQEFLGEKNGILFYDDYAHHPVEIKELYSGFREKFPNKRIGVIFEPHQHSRTKELFKGFCNIFAKIDKLGIMPIYAARDTKEDKKFTIDNFFRENQDWEKIKTKKDIDIFLRDFKKGDVVIFCGAGNVSEFGRTFLKTSK